jgi:ribokinase
MSANQITVIGSSNTDMVIRTTKLPAPGETILGGDFFMNPGGKGANQAVAAARLGGNVTLVAKVGNDIFGQQAKTLFEADNINTKHLTIDPAHPSGIALITVDQHGENCIVVASGANGFLTTKEIDDVKDDILQSTLILMQLEIPLETVEYVTEIASKADIKVILNPAPATKLSDSLLAKLYMITPNETEAELISGISVTDFASAETAARYLANKGIRVIVITMGSKGALVFNDNKAIVVSAPKVEAIDSTAAGDVFNGALAVAISEGQDLKEAVEFACKAAAISVTRLGAQASAPFRKEIS